MAQLLILDDTARQVIAEMKAFAEANPFTLKELQDIMEGKAQYAGDRVGFCREIPIGISLVYTVEEHPNGVLNHLSVSVNNKLPSPEMMQMLMEAFEFVNPLDKVYLYMEPETQHAMNVLEPASGKKMEQGVFMQ